MEETERPDSLSGTSGQPGAFDFAILVVLSIVWGSVFILYKEALQVLSWTQVGLLRIAVAGLCFSPMALVLWRKVPLRALPAIAAVGVLGSGIPPFLFALAQTRLDSGLTGILNATTPVFALLLGMAFFRLRVSWMKAAGIALGLLGAVVIILSSSGSFGGDGRYGLIVLLATTCYGASINLIKSRLQDVSPLAITVFSLLFIASIALSALPFSGVGQAWAHTPGAWRATGLVALMAVFGTALASVFYFQLIQRTSVVFSSSITYLIPVVAIAWGWMDGEVLRLTHFGGMALILAAVWLLSRRGTRTEAGMKPARRPMPRPGGRARLPD